MSITASLIGLGSAILALLVLIRVLDLNEMVRLVKRGLLAILAFFVLGSVAQMFLPGVLTAGFLACARSSLLLGVSIVIIGLALMLIAKRRASSSSQHKH